MRKTRRFTVGSVVLCTLMAMTVAPVQAAEPGSGSDSSVPAPSTRIVGGTQAPAGAWPSQVGLLSSSVGDNFQAQFCGGTVINPSWILTAAHCLEGESANAVDVLTNTQSLISGGVRHRAAELRTFPYYNDRNLDGDYALVRIGSPTNAPLQAIAAQGAGLSAGTSAVTTGWGNLVSGGNNFPYDLQQVTVPVISNSTCANSYPGAITSRMLCAGQSPYFQYDSCQGDSGGPLVVSQGGRWVQVGITSWGDGCAEGYPGVYSRVAAQSTWIKDQVRFGPHSNAAGFVRGTWRDLYNASPSNTDLFLGVAAQNSTRPVAWLDQQIQGRTYQARMGGVTRLYKAFFLRDPEAAGMDYWWTQINSGWTLWRVAEFFSQSPEFIGRYGSLNTGQYVDLVYQNVLGRAPEAAGRAFWVQQLDSGARNRGELMVGFSESPEYVRATKARTDVLITYFGLVHRVPVSSDLAFWMTQPNSSLVSALFGSVEYHQRF
ncbi:MAG TPA: trypsin-like serine protease [Acidimicrobiales bacterium]|nr:trypsin-like serine protease [Acidimicrobiales bacterium]